MTQLEKPKRFAIRYARIISFCDVLTNPEDLIDSLTPDQLDKIRITQAQLYEVVRVLGRYREFALVTKIDGTKGWVKAQALREETQLNQFKYPYGPIMRPEDFFMTYRGAPYLRGGISRAGIDSAGLAQQYFLAAHGKVIPRNARDQRSLGSERPFEFVRDHDLVFCSGKTMGTNHVGIFFRNHIWHVMAEDGVVAHTNETLSEMLDIESVLTVP